MSTETLEPRAPRETAHRHTNTPLDRLIVQATGEFPTCSKCGMPKSPGSDCEEVSDAK